jgi:hypothetical protein
MVEGNGIFLKDKSGNTNFYKDALVLEIPGQTWDGETAKEKTFVFINLGRSQTYAVKPVSSNGYVKYQILSKVEYLPYDRGLYFGISEAQYDELSYTNNSNSKYLMFMTTPKVLTIGNTYDVSEIYY